jgi:uncharacterized protein
MGCEENLPKFLVLFGRDQEKISMYAAVEEKKDKLRSLCRMHCVQRLALFGSATTPRFDPSESDLDFLVEFQPMPPGERAQHYFGLMEDLEALFGIKVDLVEKDPIRNPYFRQAVEESRVDLFDAA